MNFFLDKYQKEFKFDEDHPLDITLSTHLIPFWMKIKIPIEKDIKIPTDKHEEIFDAFLFLNELRDFFKNDEYCISYKEGLKNQHTMVLYNPDFIVQVLEKINEIKVLNDYKDVMEKVEIKEMNKSFKKI